MTKVIGVIQLKGGAGKSTVATNLAGMLNEKGSTLLIDADEPQYSANGHLGINAISTNLSFANIIFRGTPVDLEEFVVSDPDKNGTCPGFDLTTGTLVLGPRDDAIPGSATFKFGFQGDLSNNGKTVQYFLEMDGTMTGENPVPALIVTLSMIKIASEKGPLPFMITSPGSALS